jgi:hypothetical protein
MCGFAHEFCCDLIPAIVCLSLGSLPQLSIETAKSRGRSEQSDRKRWASVEVAEPLKRHEVGGSATGKGEWGPIRHPTWLALRRVCLRIVAHHRHLATRLVTHWRRVFTRLSKRKRPQLNQNAPYRGQPNIARPPAST